jgi:hypothetical protein
MGIVFRENVTILATIHDNINTYCYLLSVLFCIVFYCHVLSTILQGIGLQMPVARGTKVPGPDSPVDGRSPSGPARATEASDSQTE